MKLHLKWICLILISLLINGCAASPSVTETQASPNDYSTTASITVEATSGSNQQAEATVPANAIEPTLAPAPATEISTQSVTPAETATKVPAVKTATSTATPGNPDAAIQILAPGPASKVVSPIQVSAYLKPGARGIIRIELYGEDGRLLGRKVMVYAPDLQVHMLIEMEFEIPGAAEAGRLAISTQDSQGRPLAVSSVNILLMSMGDADINPPGDLLEDLIIQQPTKNMFIQGGTVVVSGLARTQGSDPLLVELISRDGIHIGPTRLVSVPASVTGGYSPFSVEVPYSVTAPTWVRLEVYENSGRIPGLVHLSSIEILIGQ